MEYGYGVRRPVVIRLRSFEDLVRLAVSTVVNGQGIDLFHYEEDGRHYYMLQGSWPDYYCLEGLPILYLAEGPEPGSGLLRVSLNGGFRVSWGDDVDANVTIPVVSLAEKPFFLL